MKITLDKKEFVKALQIGGMYAGLNKAISILDCIKVKVSGNSMSVISSDIQNAISISCHIENDGEGSFCIPYRDLISYVKLMDTDIVTIRLESTVMYIEHGDSLFTIPVFNADEFPVAKMDDGFIEVSIPSRYLADFISTGSDFVSNDAMRQIMNGIYIYSKDGTFGYCATDSTILAHSYVESPQMPDFQFILDRSSFNSVMAVTETTDCVKVRIGDNHIMFLGDRTYTITTCTKGRFPNFYSVIPSMDESCKVVADCANLRKAINRCSIGADKAFPILKFNIGGSDMQIECECLEMSKKAVERLQVNADATCKATIGFKKEYMALVIKHIATNNVVMYIKSPATACVMKEEKAENNQLYLIMPVKI